MSLRARLFSAGAALMVSVPVLAVPGSVGAGQLPGGDDPLPSRYAVQRIDPPSPSTNQHFGDGVVNVGDLDGDGKDDLLIGLDEHGGFGGLSVFVYSGASGSLIMEVPPPDLEPRNTGAGENGDGFGTYVGGIADVGGCEDFTGSPGDDCVAEDRVEADGVRDLLVSAIGVDVETSGFPTPGNDMGMIYVIDGATGAVLYRMVMPEADRIDHMTNAPNASQGGGFGRTILAPAGQAPCEGNKGIGPCPAGPQANPAVVIGDLDGGGKPDLVVGASDFTETTATNPACDDGTGNGFCFQAGRFYVYRGEELGETAGPDDPLDVPHYTLKNPWAQHDDPNTNSRFHREAMGYSVAPVGDLGRCTNVARGPGDYCLNAENNTTTPDGRPEFIASSHRSDDFGGMGDVGVAFVIDGPTGAILDIYRHPEPQPTSIFAFSNYNQPPIGDVGSSAAPDVYQGAMVQSVTYKAQGRGYVLSGDLRSGGANHYNIAVLDDPSPNPIGNFGTSSAGIGDLTGDGRNEIMIGAYGPHAPQVITDVVNDVHIFDPVTGMALQTIADPDQQPGSGFGRALTPLGDLNADGFLDFAVGAGPYTGEFAQQGRTYIFRSLIELTRDVRLRLGGHLRAIGRVLVTDPASSAQVDVCTDGVRVLIKRGSTTVRQTTTDSEGRFAISIPDRPGRYRAVVPPFRAEDLRCLRARSPMVRHRH